MRTLAYPKAAFQMIASPRTSAIDTDGTPRSFIFCSMRPVITVLVLSRSKCPGGGAAEAVKVAKIAQMNRSGAVGLMDFPRKEQLTDRKYDIVVPLET